MTTISNPYIIHGCDMAHLTNASTSYLPAKAQFLWQTFSHCKWIKYYPAPSTMGTALEKVHLATDLAKTRLERLPTKGQGGCWWQVFCQPPSPDLLIDLNKTNFTVAPRLYYLRLWPGHPQLWEAAGTSGLPAAGSALPSFMPKGTRVTSLVFARVPAKSSTAVPLPPPPKPQQMTNDTFSL